MTKKLISVIVSTYNSERFIKQKLEDLLKQTIIDKIEIIVVNSGSPQNEEAIVKDFMSRYNNIKYIRTSERETIYKAWNRGIKISEGEFITNSNTDDRLRNDALEILSNTLTRNKDAALVYADQYLSHKPNESFNEVQIKKVIKFPVFNTFLQLSRCLVGSQPMWRSSLHFKDNFWFDEKYEVVGDHDFQLRISQKYRMLHIPQVLGTFYKDYSGKGNKEYQDMNRTYAEGSELLYRNILEYFKNTGIDEITQYYNQIKIWTILPFYSYLINKKLREFIFPDMFNYSTEFIYLFSGLLMLKKGNLNKADKIFNKYLRHRKSDWIEKENQKLQALLKENSNEG